MIRGSRVSGYTLIEILGAFFIMTIILTLVTGIFVENGRQRAAALGMMKESLSAAAAINQFAQDVESAVFLTVPTGQRPDENPWRLEKATRNRRMNYYRCVTRVSSCDDRALYKYSKYSIWQ